MTKRSSSSRGSTSQKAPSKSAPRRSSSRKARQKPSLWSQLTWDQQLDIFGWILFIVALLTLLSLVSAQRGSLTGLWITLLGQAFGLGMYAVPIFLGAVGLWLILRRFGDRVPTLKSVQVVGLMLGFLIALMTMHALAQRRHPEIDLYTLGREGIGGGLSGALLVDTTVRTLGQAGFIIMLVIGWAAAISLVAVASPVDIVQAFIAWVRSAGHAPASGPDISQRPPPALLAGAGQTLPQRPTKAPGTAETPSRQEAHRPPPPEEEDAPKINLSARSPNGNGDLQIQPLPVGSQAWRLPAVSEVLEEGSEQKYSEDLIRKQVRVIEETLSSLGAPVRVREINQGPVVTQFGTEPQFITSRTGKTTKVKVSKIASLADDLSLALAARSIRVEAPIPGRGLVGIEVPNEEAAVVSLRDVMDSEGFANLKGQLRLGLGQDVSGQAVAADLRAMPHLLVAGATGAGKSVCVNAIIAAFLLQNSPETVRLIMVDPKRVELTQYNGIPHLLVPVIVDVDRVVPALRWVLKEMDGRYRRFANVGARNIEDYNRRIKKLTGESPIPYIVVLIDELADMMMQAPEETEQVVCRLAQMARATGIHLIIATQRPSVDVVTGLIKANFPARIAFAVASSVDSRVILDMPGAERLLGKGDMLFMPPDAGQPLRLQGAFVSDRELEKLITFWRTAVDPNAAPEQASVPQPAKYANRDGSAPAQPPLFPSFEADQQAAMQFADELLPRAVEIFLTEDRASVSLLQRRMRIGYTRSARLVEALSEMGVITSEATDGQSRKVNRSVAEALLRSVQPEEDREDEAL